MTVFIEKTKSDEARKLIASAKAAVSGAQDEKNPGYKLDDKVHAALLDTFDKIPAFLEKLEQSA